MALVGTESNIVFVYDRNINSSVIEDDFKDAIQLETTLTDEIIITTFGNAKVFVSTSANIQAQVRDNLMIVASANIQESDVFNDIKLAKIAHALQKVLADKGVRHIHIATNFVWNGDSDHFAGYAGAIRDAYFKEDVLLEDEEFVFSFPNLRFLKSDIEYTLGYTPIEMPPDGTIKKVAVYAGAHHKNVTANDDADANHIFEMLKNSNTFLKSRILPENE